MKNSLLFVLLFLVFSCKLSNENPQPERLNGIPEEAFWIGGVDGGNWYYLENISLSKNVAHISIYNDQTGEEIISKKFVLVCPEEKHESIKTLKEQIESFDGVKINLQGNCYFQ